MKRQLTLFTRPLKGIPAFCSKSSSSSSASASSTSRMRRTALALENADDNYDWHDLETVINGSGGRLIASDTTNFVGGSNHCHSCGKTLDNVNTVNVNNRFKHCYDCNMLYATSSGSSSHHSDVLKPVDSYVRRPPYPSEIHAYLNKYVIGQEEAKRTLSVGVYSHYRRLACNAEQQRIAQTFINVHSPSAGGMMTASGGGPGSGVPNGILQSNINAAISGPPDFNSVQQHHYTRATAFGFRNIAEEAEGIRLDKSNILLLGPSGVGKTFVTQILARILDVPIALGDCTSMTQAGYVGEDVESVLQKLLANAQNDVERAQRGIVFLDEIDKIAATAEASNHSYRDVSGEGVQHALLKLVEGTVANVKSDKKGPNGQQAVVPIDTSDILFIASGAFTGLEKIVGRRIDQRFVGFGSSSLAHSITVDDKEQEVINEKRDKLISKADQGDVIQFGMIPEIVGRFPILVPFHSLNKQMLVRVLTEPRNSILAQMKMHFGMDGVSLQFTESALEEIAQMALERKTGARALRSIVEKVLLLAKYEVPGSNVEEIRVTRECVRGEAPYEYVRRSAEQASVVAAAGAA